MTIFAEIINKIFIPGFPAYSADIIPKAVDLFYTIGTDPFVTEVAAGCASGGKDQIKNK